MQIEDSETTSAPQNRTMALVTLIAVSAAVFLVLVAGLTKT